MYRIRFHGRGGQGMKTASRILGSAFFAEGFEVQDAPRYGAERRGAPIFAYVRAGHAPIHERGIIRRPDLVVVADESLVPVAAAGIHQGLEAASVLLIVSDETPEVWSARLGTDATILSLSPGDDRRHDGARCAGAAAALVGVVSRSALASALEEELAGLDPTSAAESRRLALAAFDSFADQAGRVHPSGIQHARDAPIPRWIELPFEPARISAPSIHAEATSVEIRTGLWRTMRPVIDRDRCNHCSWICSTFCPDAAIAVDAAGDPQIDYDHCKGCLVCVAVCPPHAIEAIPERDAEALELDAEVRS